MKKLPNCVATFWSRGFPLIPGKEQIQTRVIRYPNTRVRISKHVCLEKNVVLERQIFTNFQDYSNRSLQLLTLQRTRGIATARLNLLVTSWTNFVSHTFKERLSRS